MLPLLSVIKSTKLCGACETSTPGNFEETLVWLKGPYCAVDYPKMEVL